VILISILKPTKIKFMYVSLLFTVNWFCYDKDFISTGTEKQPKREAQQHGRNFYNPASIMYAACSSALVTILLLQMAYIISSNRMQE
jgi:hypothetical protein